jgi:hypothetical protein
MVPEVAFTTTGWILTLAGFLGGVAIWNWIAGHGDVWGRMRYQAGDVWRMLLTQTAIVAVVMALLLFLGGLLGSIIGSPFRWVAILVGVIFWGYVGALTLTAIRGALVGKR